jgi:flagellar basal body-associated protein FliL
MKRIKQKYYNFFKKRKFKMKKNSIIFIIILFFIFLFAFFLFFISYVLFLKITTQLPSVEVLKQIKIPEASIIYDKN